MALPMADVLYGAASIGAHLGLSTRQVYSLASAGRLPVWHEGRVLLARRSSLNAWAAQREAAAGVVMMVR